VLRAALALLALTGVLAFTGCGFASSGERGSSKPDGFTLRGYVSVGTPGASASATPTASGTVCEAPSGADDVRAGGAVRVADPQGHTLAAGQLAAGVREAGRCNFGFEIANVPGGVERYVIGVGTRPTATFAAHDLRSDKPAVIQVDV
jgi:hypothetical protein